MESRLRPAMAVALFVVLLQFCCFCCASPPLVLSPEYKPDTPARLSSAAECHLTENETRALLEDFYHATGGPWWTIRGTGVNEWLSGPMCAWFGIQCVPIDPSQPPLIGVYLDNNNLTGQLPSSWSRFCLLSTVELSDNHLSGPLPALGANFSMLSEIALSNNNFSGSLPETWCETGNLGIIRVAQNSLTGVLPPCLFNYQRTTSIDLSANMFEGKMPVVTSSMLWDLDLSDNQLSGELPSEWNINLFFLGLLTINLAHNRFTGPIPEKLVNITGLNKLELTNNNLSGVLPHEIITSGSLQVLLLANNNIQGSFPPFYKGIRSLMEVIDVSNNVEMNGTISDAMIKGLPNLAYISIAGIHPTLLTHAATVAQ